MKKTTILQLYQLEDFLNVGEKNLKNQLDIGLLQN